MPTSVVPPIGFIDYCGMPIGPKTPATAYNGNDKIRHRIPDC